MNLRRSSCFSLGLVTALLVALPSAARAEAPPPPRPTVRVHVASSLPARLEHRHDATEAWAPSCEGSCDQELPRGDEYRVIGAGGAPVGDAFRLRAEPGGEVTVTVSPASTAGKVAGGTIAVAGGGLAFVSLLGLVTGISLASAKPPDCTGSDNVYCGSGPGIGKALALVSGLGLLTGTLVIVGGVALVNSSGPSTSQTRVPGADSAFVREPTWVGPRTASTQKPAFVLPLAFSF